MKLFKKVLIVGVALTTVSILGACSSDTDVLTKVGAKQPAKAEGEEVLKDQKKTPMTTSKRESIKNEDAPSSKKRYISHDESQKIEEGMTYTDILNTIDYGGENIKHYNNNENVFYTEKDTDGTYEIMVELNTYGYVVNIERTAIKGTDKENEVSMKRIEEPVKEYEEKTIVYRGIKM